MWKAIKLKEGDLWMKGDLLAHHEYVAKVRAASLKSRDDIHFGSPVSGVIKGYNEYWVVRWVEEERNEFGEVIP